MKKLTHKHHIIPRHVGGSDDPSNLVELTVKNPESRAKISESNKRRTYSTETKEKLRQAALRQWAERKSC